MGKEHGHLVQVARRDRRLQERQQFCVSMTMHEPCGDHVWIACPLTETIRPTIEVFCQYDLRNVDRISGFTLSKKLEGTCSLKRKEHARKAQHTR